MTASLASLDLGEALIDEPRMHAYRLARWVGEVEAVARRLCGNHRRLALDNQVPHLAGGVSRSTRARVCH